MKKHHLILLVILLLGLVLRLTALNDSITYDEAYTYQAFASRSLFTAISDYHLPNNHVFHSVLVFFASRIFGNHLWALRLPALFAGLGVIWAAYALGKETYTRGVGLGAAALVAFSPEEILHATDARGYSLLAFFTLLLLLLGTLATRHKKRRYWVGITISAALGFWTLPLMLFPFGIGFLWLFLSALFNDIPLGETRLGFLKNWLFSGLGAAFLTIGLYLPVLRVSGWQRLLENGFVRPVPADQYADVLASRIWETWQFWVRGIPSVLLILLIVGFFLGLVFHRRLSRLRVPLQIAAILWLGMVVFLRRPDAYSRFWSFLLAPLLIFAIAGILGWFQERSAFASTHWGENALLLLLVAFLAYQTALAIPTIPERWQKLNNDEAAAAYLAERLVPGDMVLIGYPHSPPVWYYLSKLGVASDYWQAREDFDQVYLLVANQTPEKLIQSNKLDPAYFALEEAVQLQRYGKIKIILCQRAK